MWPFEGQLQDDFNFGFTSTFLSDVCLLVLQTSYYYLVFYFIHSLCADRNQAEPTRKPKQDASTGYSVSKWTDFKDYT